jgi:NACalpha-BTF3-like transcription factor
MDIFDVPKGKIRFVETTEAERDTLRYILEITHPQLNTATVMHKHQLNNNYNPLFRTDSVNIKNGIFVFGLDAPSPSMHPSNLTHNRYNIPDAPIGVREIFETDDVISSTPPIKTIIDLSKHLNEQIKNKNIRKVRDTDLRPYQSFYKNVWYTIKYTPRRDDVTSDGPVIVFVRIMRVLGNMIIDYVLLEILVELHTFGHKIPIINAMSGTRRPLIFKAYQLGYHGGVGSLSETISPDIPTTHTSPSFPLDIWRVLITILEKETLNLTVKSLDASYAIIKLGQTNSKLSSLIMSRPPYAFRCIFTIKYCPIHEYLTNCDTKRLWEIAKIVSKQPVKYTRRMSEIHAFMYALGITEANQHQPLNFKNQKELGIGKIIVDQRDLAIVTAQIYGTDLRCALALIENDNDVVNAIMLLQTP